MKQNADSANRDNDSKFDNDENNNFKTTKAIKFASTVTLFE